MLKTYVLKRSKDSITNKSTKLGLKADFFSNFDDSLFLEEQERLSKLDNKLVGTINEDLVRVKLALEGFELFLPSTPNHKTDLVIFKNSIPVRIQVKSVYYDYKVKVFRTELITKNKKGERIRYTNNDVDFFIVKCNGLEAYYIIPYEVSIDKTMLRFYPHRNRYKGTDITNYEIYRDAFYLIRDHLDKL